MIRGASAQFKFQLPCNFAELNYIQITFWQSGYSGPTGKELPIIKTRSYCYPSDSGRELRVTLNQEETLRFSDDRKAYVQFRAKAGDGISYASKPKAITVYPVYKDSIIGDVDEDDLPSASGEEYIVLDGGIIT